MSTPALGATVWIVQGTPAGVCVGRVIRLSDDSLGQVDDDGNPLFVLVAFQKDATGARSIWRQRRNVFRTRTDAELAAALKVLA